MGKVSRRGVELQPLHFTEQQTFMVHANATLTPRGRLLLARRIVDEGWSIARAAERFHVAWPTAKRWALPPPTAHALRVPCRLTRLSHINTRTGEPIRRYEHDQPGALIHVDV